MRLEAFHIDGFGIYQDEGLDSLPEGLVLLTGENESGKTTLLEFFRFMLFGPERRAAGRNDYQPLAGGVRGGRLLLVSRDGHRLRVERRENRLTLTEDDAPAPPEALTARLRGLDRGAYRAIFAVGVPDLQGLDLLGQDQVRSWLFAAGAGPGAAAVPGVLKYLEGELEGLLKPRKGGRLNEIRDRLREIARQVRDLQPEAARFAALKAQREQLEAELQDRKAERTRREVRLKRLQLLAQAREPWVRFLAAQERLAEYEDAADFPPEAVTHRERLAAARASLEAEKEAAREELAWLHRERAGLSPDPRLLEHRQEIEGLLAEEKRLEEALRREPEERLALEQARAEAARRLQNLGPDWEEARLAQVDTSLTVRREVQEFGRRLGMAQRRTEELSARELALREAAEEARRRIEAARERLAATSRPPQDVATLSTRLAVWRRLGPLVTQAEVLRARLGERRRAQEEAEARLAALAASPEGVREFVPRWLAALPALLSLAAALGVLLLFWLARPGSGRWPWLLGGGILAAGALVSGLLALLRRQIRLRAAQERQRRREELQERQEMGAQAVRQLETELARLDAEVAAAAREAGEEPPREMAEVISRQADLEQALEAARAWLALEQECGKAEAEAQESERRLTRAREEGDQAARELERISQAWREWLTARGFSPEVTPETFEVLLQLVEAARTALAQVAQARDRLARTEEALRGIRTRLAALLARLGREPQAGEPGPADLHILRRELAEALDQEGRRRNLEQQAAGVKERLTRLEEREAQLRAEWARLLNQAGAADDLEFERRAARHQEWQEWRRQRDEALLQLTTLAGAPQRLEELEAELARSDPADLAREEGELSRRLSELAEAISVGERQVGELTNELRQLSADRRLGDLLQEEASLQEQWSREVRRYVTLALTRHLIEEARGVYERERQPEVIREADRFLRLMAHDRYRLYAPVGGGGVRLEDASRRHKEEVHWSAGLADQVYLAVRLGMAREFGRQSEPWPLILDDVLVKFDPRRRRGAARVILECARNQQVLLFSSHPECEALVRELSQEEAFQNLPVGYVHLHSGKLSWSS